jgi:hypothetical protein
MQRKNLIDLWRNDERLILFEIVSVVFFLRNFLLGYITHKLPNKAIDLFKEIQEPSEINLIIFFNACAQSKTREALNSLKQVREKMPLSFYSNYRLVTSLLDALMKCSNVKDAQLLFNTLPRKTTFMYGAMMKG